MSADAHELHKLADELRRHSRATPARVVGVVSKGALNVKRDWQRGWTGIRHAPRLPQSITYTTTVRVAGVEAEIGPEAAVGQGFLGRVIHDGGAHNAPRPAGHEALAREQPKLAAALTALMVPKL